MKRKKYYFLGIGGIAMGTLAGILKTKGHVVAGSDQGIYPPMSDMLKKMKIPVYPYGEFSAKGGSASGGHLKTFRPDIVVIGNTIKRGNPELEYIISKGLTYRSLPDVLKEEIIENGKLPIVVTGTHGKTTTTSLIAWILEYAGLDPTVFCGGMIKGFPPSLNPACRQAGLRRTSMRNINSSFKIGKGKYVVIEGDEYTTSFFDKNPKFLHYRPYIGVINNIDHDHLDVYKSIGETKLAFSKFANLIPNNGLLVVNSDDNNVKDVSDETLVNKKTFGLKSGELIAKNISFNQDGTSFDVFHLKHKLNRFHIKLIGEFNVYNCLAAISVAMSLKIPISKIKLAVSSFEGIARRAEILGEKNGKIVINDFAHHPTASRETLKGLRKMFPAYAKASASRPKKRLIALFEPGSSSSRMKIMEKPFIDAFSLADIVYIYKPSIQILQKGFTKANLISINNVSRRLSKLGVKSKAFNDLNDLLFHLKHESRYGDVIVIMSCKGFDGLKDKIWEAL